MQTAAVTVKTQGKLRMRSPGQDARRWRACAVTAGGGARARSRDGVRGAGPASRGATLDCCADRALATLVGRCAKRGRLLGSWILRIFSQNPPTPPSAKNRPRTLRKGDPSCSHSLASEAVGRVRDRGAGRGGRGEGRGWAGWGLRPAEAGAGGALAAPAPRAGGASAFSPPSWVPGSPGALRLAVVTPDTCWAFS